MRYNNPQHDNPPETPGTPEAPPETIGHVDPWAELAHDSSTPTTLFVDWSEWEATAAQAKAKRDASPARKRRVIRSVDDEVEPIRQNVQDAARAVMTWVAAVTDSDSLDDPDAPSLDCILDDCLRPGADVTAVNYEAIARHINRTLHMDLSAKRVKTAIAHLRSARQKSEASMNQPSMKQKLDGLQNRLRDAFATITAGESEARTSARMDVAVDVLAALRAAAGRIIEAGFGEGIPREIDVDELEDQFLDFVREAVRDEAFTAAGHPLEQDLRRLLITLGDYDGSATGDMRLVVDGGRVVAALAGPDSLVGIMAQLNVLVSGRDMLDSELYVAEMRRLADQAEQLHEDDATKTLLNRIRRLPEEQRIPTPLRVCSYCLNNASTHLLHRLFTEEIQATDDVWQQVDDSISRMQQRDSGFALLKVTEVIQLTTRAKLDGHAKPIEAYFLALKRDKSLQLLRDLAKFDNCNELVAAAQRHAIAAIPELKHQLIRVN